MTTANFITSKGSFAVRLMPEHAPKTVANFVELARGAREWTDPRDGARRTEPLYDGTVFHRVIDGFMVQGGDPTGTGRGGPGYEFEDECPPDGPSFDRPGLLAMANAGPGTNGCQFFVTVAPTAWLTGKHTIFGEVVQGYDVVEDISKSRPDRWTGRAPTWCSNTWRSPRTDRHLPRRERRTVDRLAVPGRAAAPGGPLSLLPRQDGLP
jgi:peptidyl-prolyl cis-trans isomerase A (cyclophilin A)